MKTFPAIDGTYLFKVDPADGGGRIGHQLTFGFKQGTLSSGLLRVEARGPGGIVFEPVPGVVDLSSPLSLLFTFKVAEYKIVLSDYQGTATQLYFVDSVVEV